MGKRYVVELNDDVSIEQLLSVLKINEEEKKPLISRYFPFEDEESLVNNQIFSVLSEDEDLLAEPDLYSEDYGKDSL